MLIQKGIKSILDRHARLNQFLDEKKYILGSIALIGLFIVFLTNSFASLTPISSVVVQSTDLDYTKSEEGSWKYTKSAKWISKGKARINIKLETVEKPRTEYTDVILVLDTSGSMTGDKLTQVQHDINDLINDTIPRGNKVALITFSDEASVLNDFTDDTATLRESINNLTVTGETNYYQALVKVDDVLNTYNKESNRDCVVLFLTDGLPTIDTPNEVSQYNYLKNKYDYLSINGIQYEFGNELLEGVESITDIQYIATKESLNEFLYKASISPACYDNFILTDYIDIDYFNLKDISNISTTFGSTSIEDKKVIWNLNGFKTGLEAYLTIDINLNDDLIGIGGIYPTHTKTDVSYKIDSINTTEFSTKTTILKDNYAVTYESNAPAGCVVSDLPDPKVYSVFDTVRLDENVPPCSGYQFKEWKIVTADVEKIGNNSFVMPESNVIIKAVWKKLNINKSMDGKIARVQTLYKLMEDNSIGLDTNVNFNSNPTDENSGIYTIASTSNDKYPVYYYRGKISNNNVLFAGFCWKIVRTTSSGGVKLIYNGVYDEISKCNNTGSDVYIKDRSSFNLLATSPADVGYMYGTRYVANYYTFPQINVLSRYDSRNSSYYYSDSILYADGKYTLVNAEIKSWSDNYSSLKGYYTCRSSSTVCSTIYYIAGTDAQAQYDISLSSGENDPEKYAITLGKNIIKNDNDTYTLTDVIVLSRKDWYANHDEYTNYYVCKDLTSSTCNDVYVITSTTNYYFYYDDTFNYVYGNDVTWNGKKYILKDTYTSVVGWNNDKESLAKKYHYTCFNTTGECNDVYYITYFGDSSRIGYLTLSSGKNIETAKTETFTNLNNSEIKKSIDSWYETNMTSYTDKLEDTIWCNDRTLYSGSLMGKDIDAGMGYSYFSPYDRVVKSHKPSLVCPNKVRDGFTVSTFSGGNGALTYPIGLLTADEMLLTGKYSSYLNTGRWYWLLSPISFQSNLATGFVLFSVISGSTSYSTTYYDGIRPAISLVSGIRSIEGNGTIDDPYIIED